MTVAVAYAALASLLFAFAHVSAKVGFRSSRLVPAYLVALSSSWFVALAATVATVRPDALASLNYQGVAFLVAAGLLAHTLGQLASMVGIDRVGPSVAIPIQMTAYALSALSLGVLFLSQQFGLLRATGVVVLLGAVWLLSFQRNTGRPGLQPLHKRLSRVTLLPGLAGVVLGGADIFRKLGVTEVPNPELAVAISLGSSLALFTGVVLAVPRLRSQLTLQGTRWFVFYGAASALGLIMVFKALQVGEVAVVSPIVASQPVVVAGLSRVFLPGLEKFTPSLLTAIGLAVSGSVLLGMS